MEAGIDKNASRLAAIQADEADAVGAMPATEAEAEAGSGVPQNKEGWQAEWAGSKKLQAEFMKAEHYAAFKKHEAGKGWAK